VQAINEYHYVDDYLDSFSDEKEAIAVSARVRKIMLKLPTTRTAPSLNSASTANTSTTLIIAHWTRIAQHLLTKKK